MKKFINPDMNVVRFDVENVLTGSGLTAEEVARQDIATNGVTAGGTDNANPDVVAILF